MANELHASYASANTLYAVVRNKEGNVWYPAGEVFETWGTGSRDAEDYCLSMIDKSGSLYIGDFDINIEAGRYLVQIFFQAGANPADSDTLVTMYEFIWSGTGQITSEKLLANKAIQDKSNGQIQYYDDDGQTILVTITPSEDSSSLTRTSG